MHISDNPLFRRLHKHAAKRLFFEPGIARSKQLPAYKKFVKLENEMIRRYHRNGDSGLKVCQARAVMVDVVVENLFLGALDQFTTLHGRLPCKVAIVATGGYGRGELNPHSDVDIMLLYPNRAPDKNRFNLFQEVLTEEILYPLWDLGWKVGHATRNTKEVIEEAKREIQSKNALMEARLISGSAPLFKQMYTEFSAFCRKDNSSAYIKQRLIDEKKRHGKAGNTPFVQEPDIKNGVGGLRDYQNILWMANLKFGYQSFNDLEKGKMLRRDERIAMEGAYDFLLRTRTELHLQNRRPTDKLDLEEQPEIATGLGYSEPDIFKRVEGFMKDYYSATRTIYLTSEYLKKRLALSTDPSSGTKKKISFREALRSRQHLSATKIDGFQLDGKVLSATTKRVFKDDPVRIIRIFRYKQQYNAEFDADLIYLISRSIPLIDKSLIMDPAAAKSFCAILRTPGEVYPILVLMHEMQILGRYVPEFGRLTCRVQHEYYHRYTADMHVLRTIKHLDEVFLRKSKEDAEYESELRKNDDPLLLYLILLLHDIGKSEGIKGHAESGVRIAKPILRRFDVNREQQEQILFIIRSHLEMARFWQKFDIEDPQTAVSFAQFIGDPQRLRFLFVHTYCDARGTAPSLWNSYKNSMHRALFYKTLGKLGDDQTLERKREEQKLMLHNEILDREVEGVSREEVEAHFSLLPERYFINTQTDEIELHLRMVNQLLSQIHNAESVGSLAPIVNWRNDIDLGMTVVNIVTWDRAGLFYKLAGALTLAHVNIISTKAISRKDHISIDTFYVMDAAGGIVTDSKAEKVFKRHLEDALIHGKKLIGAIEELEKKAAAQTRERDLLPAPFPPSVDVYHELSLKRTIIEVQAEDRIGLLYRLARLIHEKNFNISFARVATERGVAMDTFYIENIDTKEATNTANLLELREELEAIVRAS